MTDEQLTRLFRSLQTDDLPSPQFADALFAQLEREVVPRVERRTRPMWALVAATLLLAALLGIALAVGSGVLKLPVVYRTPASPSAGASPSAAATPTSSEGLSATSLSVSGWRQVESNPGSDLSDSYGTAAWSGRLFVVSGMVRAGLYDAHPPVQFWTSADGQTWSLSPVASTGFPQAYAFDGDAGVAVGEERGQAAVWTSPDSVTWSRLPNPPALTLSDNEVQLLLRDVVHGPAGYVALGDLGLAEPADASGGGPLVLWSPDGHDWQRVSMEPFQHGTEPYPVSFLDHLAVVSGRYVIAGRARGSELGSLWTSIDGRSWTESPPIEGSGKGLFVDLAAGGAGALLVGIPDQAGSCPAWHSVDGLTWRPIAGGCPKWATRLIAAPFGFVAVTPMPGTYGESGSAEATASTLPFPCAGGLQVSTTGEEWTCVVPPSPVWDVRVAVSPTELLIVGSGGGPGELGLLLGDVRVGQ